MNKSIRITTPYSASTTKMGPSQAVCLLQDGFTECFEDMKKNNIVLREKYNAFWAITKSKIVMEKAPSWLDIVRYDAFPINNRIVRTDVNCIVKDKTGDVLFRAVEELCVLDGDTRKPRKLSTIEYPTDGFEPAILEPCFETFAIDEDNKIVSYDQKIYSEYIDMSGHLNNIEYVKLAMNTFSVAFTHEHSIKTMEMHYIRECREGDILTINLYEAGENVFYCKILRQDRLVFEMKMMYD